MVISTIFGVYLAAQSGLEQALKFDSFSKMEDNYYLRTSLFDDAVKSTPEGERDKGFELVKEAAASMKEEPVEETTEEEPKGLMAR